MHEDVNWPRARTWLAGASERAALTVVGAPFNFSITPGRCDLAPSAMREVLVRFSTYDADHDLDLRDLAVQDRGDLDLPDTSEDALATIQSELARIENRVVILGGDNGVTRPGVRGLAQSLGVDLDEVGLVTIDAHFDLRDLDPGPINGNPIRGLLADGLPGPNIAQLGILPFANSAAYAKVAQDAGIRVIPRRQISPGALGHVFADCLKDFGHLRAIYVDIDLDAMDRAFAPGCPGSRPGGFTPLELQDVAFLAGRHSLVRSLDLVELDPERDINSVTAMTGASCLLSFAAGMVAR